MRRLMKTWTVVGAGLLALGMLATSAQAEEAPQRTWGVALNSSVSGAVPPMRLVPTATLLMGKSQLEAGLGVHPFVRRDQRVLSGEANYKFFPHGLENALSPYLIGRFSYVHDAKETYYPTTYHHLVLTGGYGVILNGASGSYLGTNVTVGPATFVRNSENPAFPNDELFDDLGLTLAFQFNVGYRF